MCSFNHGLRIHAGKDAQCIPTYSDSLDARDAELLLGGREPKSQVNPSIGLQQSVKGSIHQESAIVENADMICDALNFGNLMRRKENGDALRRLCNQSLE